MPGPPPADLPKGAVRIAVIPKPGGLAGIVATFGDPIPYAPDKRVWEALMLERAVLSQPILYAYGDAQVRVVRAHRLVVHHLAATLDACLAAGVPPARLHYGGCYSWRPKRTHGTQLSTHTWGIAVDLEPDANRLGRVWRDDGVMLHPKIVETFLGMGWTWGADWPTADAMHFQWADGY
jgi:hypothetical protein